MKIDFDKYLTLSAEEQLSADPTAVLAGAFQKVADLLDLATNPDAPVEPVEADVKIEGMPDHVASAGKTLGLALPLMRATALAQSATRQLGQLMAIEALKKVVGKLGSAGGRSLNDELNVDPAGMPRFADDAVTVGGDTNEDSAADLGVDNPLAGLGSTLGKA